MSTLLLTLAIAFFIVVLAIALLGIGWLITGKSKLQAGACGRDPTHKADAKEGCGTKISCQLCDEHPDKVKGLVQKNQSDEDEHEEDNPSTQG